MNRAYRGNLLHFILRESYFAYIKEFMPCEKRSGTTAEDFDWHRTSSSFKIPLLFCIAWIVSLGGPDPQRPGEAIEVHPVHRPFGKCFQKRAMAFPESQKGLAAGTTQLATL
jgi:hypothetical protein